MVSQTTSPSHSHLNFPPKFPLYFYINHGIATDKDTKNPTKNIPGTLIFILSTLSISPNTHKKPRNSLHHLFSPILSSSPPPLHHYPQSTTTKRHRNRPVRSKTQPQPHLGPADQASAVIFTPQRLHQAHNALDQSQHGTTTDIGLLRSCSPVGKSPSESTTPGFTLHSHPSSLNHTMSIQSLQL